MTGPVRASQITPASDKTEPQKRQEAVRRAVSSRREAPPKARAAVRKAQASEVVKARLADKKRKP